MAVILDMVCWRPLKNYHKGITLNTTFVQIIQEKFEFLIKNYGFALVSTTESPGDHQWEGKVIYATSTTYLTAECTRGESPLIHISRVKDNPTPPKILKGTGLMYLDLIYEYMVLENNEREIVVSIKLEDREKAEQIAHNAHLNLHSQFLKIKDYGEQLAARMSVYGELLRKYAEPFLLGDFSFWVDMHEYSVAKKIAQSVRSGYINFGFYENGTLKSYGKKQYEENRMDYLDKLKKHVYRGSLEYIEKLRSEG